MSDLLDKLADSRGRQPLDGLLRPALALVDLQRVFCDPQSPAFLGSWGEAEVQALRLVRAFEAHARPLLLTRHVHPVDDEGGLLKHFFGRLLHDSDPLAGLIDAATHLAERHPLLVKSRHSLFEAPGWQQRLEGCDSLVLAGVQTPLCVLACALDAARHGLVPVVAVDATAARNEEMQLAALRTLGAGHAHLASVVEIDAWLSQLAV